MGAKIISDKSTHFVNRLLLYVLLLSVFLLPAISINQAWPKIQIAEMLLPFLFLSVVLNKHFLAYIKNISTYLIFLGCFIACIFISMLVNQRLVFMQDYFEIFKQLKYAIVMIFILQQAKSVNLHLVFKTIFVLVLTFNFLHYINFLDFNSIIEKYYGAETHVSQFGLNSLGQPATKRMLGTMGNPNDNAILFLFFTILFFPKNTSDFKDKLFFYLTIFGLFCCQSRTGFISFIVIYFIGIYLNKLPFSVFKWDFLIIVLLYMAQLLLGNLYIGSLAGNVMEQNSVKGRFEIWQMLFQMIKQKPVFGYAPYKEYFYANKLYAENQYILITWRYGIIGLLAFLLWIGYGFMLCIRNLLNREAQCLLLFLVAILITSITNVPINNQTILLMLAIVTGMYFSSGIQIPAKA